MLNVWSTVLSDRFNLISMELIALAVAISLAQLNSYESALHCRGSCANVNKDMILSLKSFLFQLMYILIKVSALGSGSWHQHQTDGSFVFELAQLAPSRGYWLCPHWPASAWNFIWVSCGHRTSKDRQALCMVQGAKNMRLELAVTGVTQWHGIEVIVSCPGS